MYKQGQCAVFPQGNTAGPKKGENPVTHRNVGGAGEHCAR